MENKRCVLDEEKMCNNCGECDKCDLDPNKICDNCGKCLDVYNTDDKGFLKVGIDKILMGEGSDLESFYTMAGLDDDDDNYNYENDYEHDCHHDCDCVDDHSHHNCDCGHHD